MKNRALNEDSAARRPQSNALTSVMLPVRNGARRYAAFELCALAALASVAALPGCHGAEGRDMDYLERSMPPLHRDLRNGNPIGTTKYNSSQLFLTPAIEAADAGLAEGDRPETSRGDARLALDAGGPVLATAQWPQPEAPSLEYPRYIYNPTAPNTFVVYLPRYSYASGGSSSRAWVANGYRDRRAPFGYWR
ncbi:hypothetical protein BH11PLA1_BH11PLA1_15930 [soil metagenome]